MLVGITPELTGSSSWLANYFTSGARSVCQRDEFQSVQLNVKLLLLFCCCGVLSHMRIFDISQILLYRDVKVTKKNLK